MNRLDLLLEPVLDRMQALDQKRLQAAAKAAGMILAEEAREQRNAAADAAMASARDRLRSRLTPPRPYKEIPDR